jgi:hypothetical protein
LRQVIVEQGYNTRAFAQLVQDNEQILDELKVDTTYDLIFVYVEQSKYFMLPRQYNLRQNFVSEMAKLILRSSDKNGDMTIDADDSRKMALRLKIQLQPHGIE